MYEVGDWIIRVGGDSLLVNGLKLGSIYQIKGIKKEFGYLHVKNELAVGKTSVCLFDYAVPATNLHKILYGVES